MFHFFRKHTKDGLEKPDPTPSEIPLSRPLTLAEQIVRFTSNPSHTETLRNAGVETFDEADDLEVEDDEYVPSPYEEEFFGKETLPVQTRLDEQRSGMVEEMPLERSQRAQERLKPKKQPKFQDPVKEPAKQA